MKDTNLIIGKQNTGKTTKFLFNEVNNAIKNNENLCIFDTRDEYYINFSKELKENDYNVLVLNLNDVIQSNGYNPLLLPYLLYKEGNLDLAVSMISDLALEIFKEEKAMDPFWENMAANYFSGLVLILFKEAKLEEINLGSIQVMMNQGEEKIDEITRLEKYLTTVDATSNIYSMLSAVVFAPNETKGSIIAVARQKLNAYFLREQLLNLLNTNEINLNELSNKTAIFIIGKKAINAIANIFINQLIEISKYQYTYILDNFDELKRLINFENLIKDASYEGNKVYAVAHNEEELKEKYNKYIIDNFQNIIYTNENNEIERSISSLNDECIYPTLPRQEFNYINFKEIVNNLK